MNNVSYISDWYGHLLNQTWQGTITTTSDGNAYKTQELCDVIDQLNNSIQDSFQFGDRIIIQIDHSITQICWMIYLWHIGATLIPIDKSLNQTEIDVIADDCQAQYFIDLTGNIQPLHPKPMPKFVIYSQRKVTGNDLALIIYTSGSTGKPKGIMLSHQNVVCAIHSIAEYLALTAHDSILAISPLSFDYGLYQLFFSWHTSCDIFLFDETINPMKVFKRISQYKISVLPSVPALGSTISRLLPLNKYDLSSLTKFTNTGGHLSKNIIDTLLKFIPQLNIYPMYGLTESKRALFLEPQQVLSKPNSVGKPMPGLDAKVFIEHDDHFIEAKPNQTGNLFVRSITVMQGYTHNNNSGAQLISGDYRDDNWLNTGDLFSMDEDGYFFFQGREKDLIKQNGFCLFSKDIEDLISQNELVHLAAVVEDEDKFGNEIAHLLVQLIDNSEPNRHALTQWFEEQISLNYRPQKLSFINEFIWTTNGKVNKKGLKEMVSYKIEPESQPLIRDKA